MRALFTTQPGTGGFRPLVPFAHALAAAGYAFACPPSFISQVEAAGFEAFPAGIDWLAAELTKAFPDAPPPGPGRSMWGAALFRHATARAAVPDLLAIAERWAPDVLVRAPEEFGACLAAELRGLPHAVAGALWFRPQLPYAEPHNEARRAIGRPPDPEVLSPLRYLALASMPPAWVAPDEPTPRTAHFIRPQLFEGYGDPMEPSCRVPQDGLPLVHAALGTTEVNRTPGLYEAIIAGLRNEPDDAAANLVSKIGPKPSKGRPTIVFGGMAAAAFNRAARRGDGWILGGGTAADFRNGMQKLSAAWTDAGRQAHPRTMALAYFALGDDAQTTADAYLRHYYAWLGDAGGAIAQGAAVDADAVRKRVESFAEAGCGELVFIPCDADPQQVELLADALA